MALAATILFADIVDLSSWRILILRRSTETPFINAAFVKTTMTCHSRQVTAATGPRDNPWSVLLSFVSQSDEDKAGSTVPTELRISRLGIERTGFIIKNPKRLPC